MIRWLKRGILALFLVFSLALGSGWWLLSGSLAKLDGDISLRGLSASATIERDALGVVTIHAGNEIDAMHALGYVHAQEHFFEMDLLRRSAAGELSELFGKLTLDVDKQHRIHRFRARALDQIQIFAGDKMEVLKAYTNGVNAGLADLRARPWPYLLLQAKPEAWQLSDTPLAGYAMYFDLEDGSNTRELALWRIKQAVPPALYKLIVADGSQWDAPLKGLSRGNVRLPDAATLDLRKLPAPGIDGSPSNIDSNAPGSNNFAITGALTKDGRAILADDMHLDLQVPDIWFRARLLYPDAQAVDGNVDISGFTLPGVPGVIVGSNTHVAWGFTNSFGDWADWVQDCRDATAAVCAKTEQQQNVFNERIQIKGSPPFLLTVVDGPHGTRIPEVAGAAKLSLLWTAHFPGALTLGSLDIARARDVRAAVDIENHAGVPPENVLIADSNGHIAWTIAGRIPRHFAEVDCDRTEIGESRFRSIPTQPSPMATGSSAQSLCVDWGSQNPEWADHNPAIVDPTSNRLWSANNRVADGAELALIGDSGYVLGARAKQIRDDLFAKNQFTEKDLLAIQLDDRALFLERWWKQLRSLVQSSNDPVLKRIEAVTRQWDSHASADAVSYRIVRAWRIAVLVRIEQGLMAPAQVALGKEFLMPALEQREGLAWELLSQQPANLLPRKFGSWDELLIDGAHSAISKLEKLGPLAQRSWGERNTASICHPLTKALPPFLRPFLCMPADELSGDSDMPRVAAPGFGASERMVVSPGHEADGIVEMPGGQSDNPLSPFWGAGHAAWVRGEATPFLPGPTTHTLRLVPAR